MTRGDMISEIVTRLNAANIDTVRSVYRVIMEITVDKRPPQKRYQKTLELFEHMFYHGVIGNSLPDK